MTPIIKYVAWGVVGIVAVGGLAIPKVLPMLHSQDAKSGGDNSVAASGKADKKQDAKKSGAGDGEKSAASKNGGESRAPLKVSTITVERAPFAEVLNSTGSLRAEESVELQAEINGKVVAINFKEGAHVNAGALLVKLNDADLRATRQRAQQRKQLATLREQRLAKLVKEGVARQEEYDTAWNELQVQNSEIELAEAQIAKTEIRAPFSGVVGLRYVSEGAFVNAATRVATLQRLDQLKVDFSIPEKYAGRIKPGSPITFTVAGGDQKFKGQIYAFDPRIDTSTRTVLLRALCPNPDGRLLPGAFANVELTLAQMNDAILIPSEAVIPGLKEKNVFVIADGKAVRRAVETGTRTESRIHILAGLNPGDVVITSGLQQMRDGLAVVSSSVDNQSPKKKSPAKEDAISSVAGTASIIKHTDVKSAAQRS